MSLVRVVTEASARLPVEAVTVTAFAPGWVPAWWVKRAVGRGLSGRERLSLSRDPGRLRSVRRWTLVYGRRTEP